MQNPIVKPYQLTHNIVTLVPFAVIEKALVSDMREAPTTLYTRVNRTLDNTELPDIPRIDWVVLFVDKTLYPQKSLGVVAQIV